MLNPFAPYLLILSLLCFGASAAAQDEPSNPLESDLDRQLLAEIQAEDEAIEQNLRIRLTALPGMDDVRVEVQGGWVRLTGSVDEAQQIDLAETAIANQDGVLQVDNQLSLTTNVAVRVSPLLEAFQTQGRQWLAALPLFLAALFIVVLGFYAGRWINRLSIIDRLADERPFVAQLLRQVIRLASFVTAVLIALDLLDATALLGAMLGAAGVAGIAFGFAFRDVVENYIAGILLSIRQPFKPKDFVVIDGHQGSVARLNSRATILLTPDGNHLRLPNALVFKSVMLNYSRNPTRRFDFELGVATDADLDRACELGQTTIRSMVGVLTDPAPTALIANSGDSTMILKFTGWVDQRVTDFHKARSEAIRLVKVAFEQHEIEMPDPGFRVDVREWLEAEVAEAAEDVRQQPEAPDSPVVQRPQRQRDLSPDEAVQAAVERERARAPHDRLSEDAPQE